jgi:hypothetical protein
VLAADVLVVAPMRLFPRLDQGAANAMGKVVSGQNRLLVVGRKISSWAGIRKLLPGHLQIIAFPRYLQY